MSRYTPPTSGLTIAQAIAKIFTRNGIEPRIVVDPKAGPSWSPSTNIITLPALPTATLDERQQAMLRAFFWHESMGELGNNTYWDNPAIKGNRQRHMLANGIGDGYLDTLILRERVGAGLDIREQVDLDCKGLLADGPKVKPTVGIAACMARYIVEGVTTWAEARAALPQCNEFFDSVEPVIPDGIQVNSGDDVVRLTLALDAALEDYKQGNQPEPEPEQGKGQGQGDKGKSKDKDSGDEDGESSGPSDISLDPSDDDAEPEQGEGGDSGDDEGSEGSEGGEGGDPADEGDDADEGSGKGKGKGSGEGDADDDAEGGEPSEGNATGKGKASGNNPTRQPRDLELGEDSGDRISDALSDMLTGGAADGQKGGARTFAEDFRCVVTGKELDAYNKRRGYPSSYTPSPEVAYDASVMLTRMRAALQGPSMRMERGQEFGRFDVRRAAAAISGSRSVYVRRREIIADSVAVSVAWDESYSMSNGNIDRVRELVERMAVALQQMPNVATEFTGWTTGYEADEKMGTQPTPNFALQGTAAHTAGEDATHRVYKSFAESATALGPRLMGIAAQGGTPMTEGFAFSAKRLAERPENRKVFFFLTDGQASDEDISDQMAWGYNALKYEVDRATAAGITVVVFGLGMDRSADMEKAIAACRKTIKQGGKPWQDEAAIRATYQRQDDSMTKPWGPNARILLLPQTGNVVQRVTDSLVNIITKQSRSIAV